MERVDKTDKLFQFFFGAGCGSKTIIYVAAKKFWFGTVEQQKYFDSQFSLSKRNMKMTWQLIGIRMIINKNQQKNIIFSKPLYAI